MGEDLTFSQDEDVVRQVEHEPEVVLDEQDGGTLHHGSTAGWRQGGLDEGDLDHLAAILRSIRDAGATILLVEHNFRLVLDLADDIFVLAEGEVFAHGTPDEIAAHPGVLEEYLGVRGGEGEPRPDLQPPTRLHPAGDGA